MTDDVGQHKVKSEDLEGHMNQVYAEIEDFIPQLRRYALALSHNPIAADDLVQESVARALTKADLFNAGTNLRAWLFTIMHNVHISSARRQKHIGMPIDPDIAAAVLTTQPTQESPLVMKALEKAMQVIPDAQRVAVIMAGIEGMSYEEIAEQLNVPVGTVKSRVSRGRDALRKALHGRENSWHQRTKGDRRKRVVHAGRMRPWLSNESSSKATAAASSL
jgi:RNA polymerase sigma-70 factor (ECF subfamily)